MENNGAWVIRIENKTGGNKSPMANDSGKSNNKYTSGQLAAQGVVKGLVAYNKFGAPFIEQAVQHTVGTIELRTGASELQQRTEFALSIAKTVGGLATSVLTGYAIGNLPGALIGGLISVATTAYGYMNRAQTLNYEQNLESITLRGMNVRAGGYAPSAGASRLGNQ